MTKKTGMTNLACAMELEDYEAGSFRFDGWGPEQKKEIRKAVRLLQEAGRQNDPGGFSRLVYHLLRLLHVEIPDGAIELRFPHGRPGKAETKTVINAWESLDCSPLDKQTTEQIAKIVYAVEWEQYKAAKPQVRNAGQKKLRDRVRATILRHVEAATKPPALS